MSKRTELELQLFKAVQALLHETKCKEITLILRSKRQPDAVEVAIEVFKGKGGLS